MSIQLSELTKSRSWTTGADRRVEYLYTLSGTSDDIAARDFVEANVPNVVDNLPRRMVEMVPEFTDTVTNEGRFAVLVEFGPLDILDNSQPRLSFDTTGGKQHITNSIETIASFTKTAGQQAPNQFGSIGVTKDGVDGVDISVPVYKFVETHIFLDTNITPAYRTTLFGLTARINNADWKGFDAGEVLFLGVVGTKISSLEWELTFTFACLPNKTNISVGDITITAKWGWEHLWIKYVDSVQGTGNAAISTMKPDAAYVEKVYGVGNMLNLNIGA